MSRDFKKPRDQRIKKSYEWKLPKVSHHPAKLGDNIYCGVEHNGFSLPGVSQDCVTKAHVTLSAGDTKCNSQRTRFGDHRHCESGNIMVLVCHHHLGRPRNQRILQKKHL